MQINTTDKSSKKTCVIEDSGRASHNCPPPPCITPFALSLQTGKGPGAVIWLQPMRSFEQRVKTAVLVILGHVPHVH